MPGWGAVTGQHPGCRCPWGYLRPRHLLGKLATRPITPPSSPRGPVCAGQLPLCFGEISTGSGKHERKRNATPQKGCLPFLDSATLPWGGRTGPAVPEGDGEGASAGRGQGQAPLPAWKVTGVVREPQPTGVLGHLQPGDADTAGPRRSGQQIHTPVWVGLQLRYCFPGGSAGKECRRPQFDSGIRKIRSRGTGSPLQHSWASLLAQLVKNPPAMREPWVQSQGWEDPPRREWLPTPVFWPGEFHGL